MVPPPSGVRADRHPRSGNPCSERTRPHLVTLKILKSRTQRNTEMPRGDMISSSTRIVSVIPPHTTKQSNRLKRETKYAWRPKLYILTSISHVNRAKRTLLAISGNTSSTRLWDLAVGAPLTRPQLPSHQLRWQSPKLTVHGFAPALFTHMWQEHPWSACLPGSSPAGATTQTFAPWRSSLVSLGFTFTGSTMGRGSVTHNLCGFQGLKAYTSAFRPSYYFCLFQSHKKSVWSCLQPQDLTDRCLSRSLQKMPPSRLES